MGSKVTKSKSRRGRKLLVLGLIGIGAAVYKATRQQAAAPAPAPAPTPAPAPSPAVEPEPEAIERLETESPAVPDVEPEAAPEAVAAPEPLAEPVLAATDDLHDIVEEPWAADAEVTPAEEPPADSLTSFFDEVMTDTAERKLRKGR